MMPADQVECRSDHAYLGYPMAFYWQGHRLQVSRIISESHRPAGYSFEVLTQELGQFELIYDLNADQWSVLEQGAYFATVGRISLSVVASRALFVSEASSILCDRGQNFFICRSFASIYTVS